MTIDDYDSLLNKLLEIENQAEITGSFYNRRNLSQAVIVSEKALDIINEVQNRCPMQIKNLFELMNPTFKILPFLDSYTKTFYSYLGISYVQLGQFQNAIKILSLSLKNSDIHRDSRLYYKNLTQFIEVAQKIPLSNTVVCKAHGDVSSFLDQNGKLHWRHEFILMKSRYEFLRGNFEEAYYLAKEALAISRMSKNIDDRYSGQVWDFHYDGLVSVCLALNQVPEAKSYISHWADSEDQMPINRLVRMNKCLSDIARFEGNLDHAEKYARIAIKYSDDTDYEETQFSSLCSLLNSFIGSGRFEDAKKYFEKVLKLESSERLFTKFHLCLLKLKIAQYTDSIGFNKNEMQNLLMEYGGKLDGLLAVNYYQTDLLNINKTIVY